MRKDHSVSEKVVDLIRAEVEDIKRETAHHRALAAEIVEELRTELEQQKKDRKWAREQLNSEREQWEKEKESLQKQRDNERIRGNKEHMEVLALRRKYENLRDRLGADHPVLQELDNTPEAIQRAASRHSEEYKEGKRHSRQLCNWAKRYGNDGATEGGWKRSHSGGVRETEGIRTAGVPWRGGRTFFSGGLRGRGRTFGPGTGRGFHHESGWGMETNW